MKWLAVVLSFLLLLTSAHAQTFSVRCKFSDGQVTDFDSGIPRSIKTNDLGELLFDQIDVKKNRARLIGNSGAVTIKAFAGFESVHLIEATDSGNMNITTIFVPSNLKSVSSFPVVHSRHVHALSGPLPSQYVGICIRL
jgi:hypothetical protein